MFRAKRHDTARGSDQATGAATSAQNISNTTSGNSQALYSTLAPQLEAEAAHPAGFSPTDMADMTTSQEQAAGGSEAGAVGEGLLHAARTRNAGGADAAIGESARAAGRQLSSGVLGTQLANQRLKQQEQQAGMSGLEGLFGTDTGASVGALGQVASNVNADTEAENASWDWTKGLSAIGGALGGASYKGVTL